MQMHMRMPAGQEKRVNHDRKQTVSEVTPSGEHYAVCGSRPLDRSSASVEGSLPLNILKTSAGAMEPPRASTVSLKRLPKVTIVSSLSRPASSKAPNASALSTSAHLYE